MQITVSQLASVLNIPVEQVYSALQEAGIVYTQERPLTDREIDRLRPVLFRYYRPVTSVPKAPKPVPVQEPAGPSKEQREEPDPVLLDPQMEDLVQSRKIMIDTCSLMHEKCEDVVQRMLPALQRYQQKAVIPFKVIQELEKHQHNPELMPAAKQGLKLCEMLQRAGCLSIRGSQHDNFADNAFFVAFSNYRYQHHMLLITQDRKLTQDILQLNELKTSGGYPVEVMHITLNGALRPSSLFW